jgi:hypothetical protein
VEIAVHPWKLELVDPASSGLADTVVSVRHDRGRTRVRLTRFIVEVSLGANGNPAIAEGATVGLRAAPEDVWVLPPRPDDGAR